MLELDRAKVSLGSNLFEFTLRAAAPGIQAILGRSGAGKSTLLNLIAGFVTPVSGDVCWNGESLLNRSAERRPVTTLFQQHNLFDHLTVDQNVGLGIHPGLKLTEIDHVSVKQVLAQVGLTNHGSKLPSELSGGEQQRVALARCLLRKQPLLLLDEPFSALDESTRQEMLALTHRVIHDQGLCVLFVTHSASDAAALGANIWHLSNGKLSPQSAD